ncbi:MAG: ACT domain-containing protein [Phycisphaerae bacterium]
MAFKISKVDVWAVDLHNRPGMLARVLEGLASAKVNIEFVVARRVTENTARAFVAPLKGAAQLRMARDLGLNKAAGMHVLRIEGPDRPGVGAEITRKIADSNLNLRGLSAAAIGKRSVCYIAFASAAEAQAAQRVVTRLLRGR